MVITIRDLQPTLVLIYRVGLIIQPKPLNSFIHHSHMSLSSTDHQTSISILQTTSTSAPTLPIMHSTPIQPIGQQEAIRQTIACSGSMVVGIGSRVCLSSYKSLLVEAIPSSSTATPITTTTSSSSNHISRPYSP